MSSRETPRATRSYLAAVQTAGPAISDVISVGRLATRQRRPARDAPVEVPEVAPIAEVAEVAEEEPEVAAAPAPLPRLAKAKPLVKRRTMQMRVLRAAADRAAAVTPPPRDAPAALEAPGAVAPAAREGSDVSDLSKKSAISDRENAPGGAAPARPGAARVIAGQRQAQAPKRMRPGGAADGDDPRPKSRQQPPAAPARRAGATSPGGGRQAAPQPLAARPAAEVQEDAHFMAESSSRDLDDVFDENAFAPAASAGGARGLVPPARGDAPAAAAFGLFAGEPPMRTAAAPPFALPPAHRLAPQPATGYLPAHAQPFGQYAFAPGARAGGYAAPAHAAFYPPSDPLAYAPVYVAHPAVCSPRARPRDPIFYVFSGLVTPIWSSGRCLVLYWFTSTYNT